MRGPARIACWCPHACPVHSGASRPEWTSEPPKEPGFYWAWQNKRLRVLEVDENGQAWAEYRARDWSLGAILWWPIPIQPPPAPEGP